MSDERRYTMEDAVILGRRYLCESSDTGHQIDSGTFVRRNANGAIVSTSYGCRNCDVVVELSYPSLEP